MFVSDTTDQGVVLDGIRRAFALGRCAEGEELLSVALDAGLAWDLVTRTVAEGVACRFSGTLPDGRPAAPVVSPA